MKLRHLVKTALLLAGAVCLIDASQIQAQDYDDVTNKISVSGSYFESGTTNTADNGSGKMTGDKKGSISTSTLLNDAWQAEGNTGNAPHNAELVLYYNGGSYGFAIEATNTLLYDLTGDGIMTNSDEGPDLSSTGSFGTNGPGQQPFSTSTVTVWSVGFSGNGISFSAQGVATLDNSLGAPSKNGDYKVSGSISFTGGVGLGTIDSGATPVVVSGFTITGSGSATVNPNASGGAGDD